MMTEYEMPLEAIVGQDELKLALALAAISPRIGGVLIQGERGNAKSTTVRAFSRILPHVSVRANCPYHCDPANPFPFCSICAHEDADVVSAPAPFVELPLGATEDRVLGHLDLEKVLQSSQSRFAPGLLAQAHRGILYVDEVNLLDDQLIDLLLDAASSGTARVERDGFSLSYPSRFVLVGTMNPEEGEIRPQLLDRFGLSVQITTPQNVDDRVLITERRLAFDQQPEVFTRQWEDSTREWRERLLLARHCVPEVYLAPRVLRFIAEIAVDANVEGLRADIVMAEASRAYAAFYGKLEVSAADVERIAPLVLWHRRRPPAPVPPPGSKPRPSTNQSPDSNTHSSSQKDESAHTNDSQLSASRSEKTRSEDSPDRERNVPLSPKSPPVAWAIAGPWPKWPSARKASGRNLALSRRMGQPPSAHFQGRNRKLPGSEHSRGVDWGGTIIARIKRQHLRPDPSQASFALSDVIFRQSKHMSPVATIFVVDTSASMGSIRRLGMVKSAIVRIAEKAYRKRVYFALLTFGHQEARTLLNPSKKLGRLKAILEKLPAHGDTPLWDGLQKSADQLKRWRYRQPWFFELYLMTDGKLPGLTTQWSQHFSQAQEFLKRLNAVPFHIRVVDADSSRVPMYWAQKLAQALGASYERLDAKEVSL